MIKYEPKLEPRHVENLPSLLPNLAADLDPDQPVYVWRELKPQRNSIEFTVYYFTPDGHDGVVKKRIDFDVDENFALEGDYRPENCKITYWGRADRAIV